MSVLAVVGGGSTYTPELVAGLVAGSPVSRLVLIDPDLSRLAAVAGLARRMAAHAGSPLDVHAAAGLEAAEDADAVIIQLRVGGQAARLRDETLPLTCGCVGQETTGAGGLGKALRTVPVVLDIAARLRTVAPRAWLVDFTNPVGIVTRALLDAGHRAVGLCNVEIGVRRRAAALLGVPPSRVTTDHVGLNHLSWTRRVMLDDVDVLPRLLSSHGEALAAMAGGLPVRLLRELGCVPSYYLRYFYAHAEAVAEQRAGRPRAAEVMDIERELLRAYADPSLHAPPELLARRGGAFYSRAALDLLAGLLGSESVPPQVLDVANAGVLPFLPDEAVVEVPCSVGPSGARALPVAEVAPLLAGLIAHVAAYEELAVAAAVHGGAHRVRAALLAHPLIGSADVAARLADAMIAADRAHLPWARG